MFNKYLSLNHTFLQAPVEPKTNVKSKVFQIQINYLFEIQNQKLLNAKEIGMSLYASNKPIYKYYDAKHKEYVKLQDKNSKTIKGIKLICFMLFQTILQTEQKRNL